MKRKLEAGFSYLGAGMVLAAAAATMGLSFHEALKAPHAEPQSEGREPTPMHTPDRNTPGCIAMPGGLEVCNASER